MATALTSVTEQIGIGVVSTQAATELGWTFRSLPTADVGIDGQLEVVVSDAASGRLLGVQVKAGPSYFTKPIPDQDGWAYSENDQIHRDYWLNYDLPVLLVLVHTDTKIAYWQHITAETAQVTGKGFKVIVPAHQRLDVTAKEELSALARIFRMGVGLA